METLLPRIRHPKKELSRRPMSKPGCKKHPKHRQSPGVCSLCLGERLAQLKNSASASASRRADQGSSSASSLSSYYSSSSASSCSSPAAPPRGYGHVGKVLFGGSGNNINSNVLKKSRSLAFVPWSITRPDHNHDEKRNKGNRSGFWSKLINGKVNKRTERGDHHQAGRVSSLAMHSRTVRERSSVPEILVQS